MNQNQEKVISVLENFIDQIKNEQIEVYETEVNNGGIIEHRINALVRDIIITIMYKKIPPKLTQKEIYQQLRYESIVKHASNRVANIYASRNTVKVWREQWVN